MSMPQLSSCAELLMRVASTAQDTSKGTRAAHDSSYIREVQQDADVGDQGFEFPYQFTHTVIGALIYAAGERLATLSWCVAADPIPHIMSAAELARAAAEASAQASWLGASDIVGADRLSRLLGILVASADHEKALARELGIEPFTSATDDFLEWGSRNGIGRTNVPSKIKLLEQAAASGRADYRRLSASAHSTLFAVIGTWIEIVEAQEKSNFDSITGHTWAVALAAASYVLDACVHRLSVHGRGLNHVTSLQQEIAAWYERLYRAAGDTDWPGTVPPT
jgi:hypothetical protein